MALRGDTAKPVTEGIDRQALLWLAILATIVAFWRVRPLAAALLLPYLGWVSFAAYLNAGIARLN